MVNYFHGARIAPSIPLVKSFLSKNDKYIPINKLSYEGREVCEGAFHLRFLRVLRATKRHSRRMAILKLET